MGWFSFSALLLSAATLVIVLKERSRRPYAGELAEFREATARLMAEFNRVSERNIGILDDRIAALSREIRRAQNSEEALKASLDGARIQNLPEAKKARSKKPSTDESPKAPVSFFTLRPADTLPEALPPSLRHADTLPEALPPTIRHADTLPEALPPTIRHADTLPEALPPALRPADTLTEAPMGSFTLRNKYLPHPPEAFAYGSPPPEASPPEREEGLFEGFPITKIKAHTRKPKHEILLQYLRENKNREELLEMGFSPNEINLALLSLSAEEGS